MSEESLPLEFASPALLDAFQKHFLRLASILHRVDVKELAKVDPKLYQCALLFHCIADDAESICLLGQHGYSNQATMVHRAFLEKIVTLIYLQVTTEDEFKAYFLYSIQKTYRLMDRNLKVNDDKKIALKFKGDFDLSAHPEMKEAVDRFTRVSGKVKTRWVNGSIETKLSVIEKAGVIDAGFLMFPLFYVYDDASEALHGTMYGCLVHFGIYEPGAAPTSAEERAKHHRRHLALLFWFGITTLHTLNKYVLWKTKQDALLAESQECFDTANEQMGSTIEKK